MYVHRTSPFGILMFVALAPVLATGAASQDRPGLRTGSPTASTSASLLRASAARRRTELVSRDVAMRLDEARRARDRIRARCLDDTLSGVGALLRAQDARIAELRRAPEAQAGPQRQRYESMLAAWDERMRDLRRQADACIGEASRSPVTVVVEATADPARNVDVPSIRRWNDATDLRLRP